MKQLNLLLAFIVITTAFSCSDYARLERKEDKLIGAWEFDKAFYRDDWDLFRHDVMDDFRGDIIEFYDDYSAVYDDSSEGLFFDGEWEMFFEREWDDEGDEDIEFYLDMYFFEPNGAESFAYFTSVNLLTQNKLHLRAHTRNGVFTFKLRRI